MLGKWHEAFDSEFDTFQFFIWHKTNPAPKIFRNGFLNSFEMIACMWNKGHKWNFSNQHDMHNFFESPICMKPERLSDPKHPAQKPVKLPEHIRTELPQKREESRFSIKMFEKRLSFIWR